MDEKARAEEFLTLFNQLEHAMRERIGVPPNRRAPSHHALLEQMCETDVVFRANKSELFAFKDLRNAIVHNATADLWNPIAAPHAEALAFYGRLVGHVLNPPAVETIAIPRHRIFHRTLADSVISTLATMAEKSYGLAPILSEERVIGALSDVSLVRAAVAHGELHIGPQDLISSLGEHVLFDRATPNDVSFCAPGTVLAEIEAVFDQWFAQHRLLLAVLVTKDGTKDGDLLGLVTAHDLVGAAPTTLRP